MKTALVTGANSGFGYLTALKFARNGYKVYATTRSLEKEGVKELNEIAKKENLNIEWLVIDVTDDSSINDATKGIESLDVLVNNAGYGAIGALESFTSEDFKKQLDTNVVGIHRMVKRFVPLMKEKRSGKIVNIGSLASRVAFAEYSLYASSKHAVSAYTEVLRQEVFRYGIDVAIIEPGSFKTNFGTNVVKRGNEDEVVSALSKRINKAKKMFVNFGLATKINNPQKVADLIYKLTLKKRMPLHNIVGFDAKLISFYKKWMPDIMWDKLMTIFVK